MELRTPPKKLWFTDVALISYVPMPATRNVSDMILHGKNRLTLVIVILARVIAIQLAQEFDDIGIGIGATERVTGAIEAEDELPGL